MQAGNILALWEERMYECNECQLFINFIHNSNCLELISIDAPTSAYAHVTYKKMCHSGAWRIVKSWAAWV